MPTQRPHDVTLNQGEFTLLHQARFAQTRVTITALSDAEAGGVVFRTTRQLLGKTSEFVGTEVFLRLIATMLGVKIEATPPAGVGSLDITYVVKTGADAGSP